jgi:hypothetical protein
VVEDGKVVGMRAWHWPAFGRYMTRQAPAVKEVVMDLMELRVGQLTNAKHAFPNMTSLTIHVTGATGKQVLGMPLAINMQPEEVLQWAEQNAMKYVEIKNRFVVMPAFLDWWNRAVSASVERGGPFVTMQLDAYEP